MNASGARPWRRRFWKFLLFATPVVLLLLGSLAWYVTTPSFEAMVRRRLVTELEQVTGGRVELGNFHVVPFRLRVDVQNVTIHGRETPDQVPYAHVDRLTAQMKIISILGAEFGFNSLVLDRPVIHIIVYPDGTTNQPTPSLERVTKINPVEKLFSLSIGRLEVRQGELIWNDQKIPLDFTTQDVYADMSYSFLFSRYESNLLIGKGNTKFQDYRPLAWMVEAHFDLFRDRIDIKSFRASSGKSRMEASGEIKDFKNPQANLTYKTSIDLAEAAAIARRATIRGGVLQAEGQGTWSTNGFSSNGKMALRNLEAREGEVGLRDASMNADYSLSAQQFSLSKIQARLFGGSVTGDAEVANWLSPAPVSKFGKGKNETQKGTVRLKIKDLAMGELAAAFSTPARPLNRLNLAGQGNGTLNVRWTGSVHNADMEIALDVAAPANVRPSQLPLDARVRATYRGSSEELEVMELSAKTRATQIRALGKLSSMAAMRFSVTTTDLGEWQPVLAAFGNRQQIPVALHGRASFHGTATGRFSAPVIAGILEMQDFDSILPATAYTPRQEMHWDSLVASMQLSPFQLSAHSGMLRRGDASISFDLNANLLQGVFTKDSPFTARVAVRNANLVEAMAMAGYHYPATGTMDLDLQVSGTQNNPHGDGHVHLSHAELYGEAVQDLGSQLRIEGREIQFKNFQLIHDDARLAGDLAYNFTNRALQFNLVGSNFELAKFPKLQNKYIPVEGRVDFNAKGSGTVEAPVVNAQLHFRDLTFDHERAGNFTLNAVTHGTEMHLTGHSEFEKATLSLEGDVHLRDDFSSNVRFQFTQLDVDPLLRMYLQGRLSGHSAVGGSIQLRGPLRRPRDLDVSGNLDDFIVDVESMKLRNSGPVRFALSGQSFNLEQFHLVGERTDLAANGTIGLDDELPINMKVSGRVNLRLIESFNRNFTSSGVVTVDTMLSGTIAHPLAQGKVEITRGAIAYIDLPSALSDINGTLTFNQNRLQIESLTAHTGGGLVTFSGYAEGSNRSLRFDLGVQGQDVRLRYPPGISSTANMDLHFIGNSSASTLSGNITVNKLSMTPGFDFGAYLQRSAQAVTLPQTDPLLNHVRLDVHIVTTPELQMQTAVIRLSGDADLRLRGTAAKPALLGRADILEGEVYFNGTKYRLERGDVTFLNPASIQPVLDLQATTRVRDYDITLIVNGPPDKLNVTYRSEPPLPAADIVALLALGRTREESAQLQQSGQSVFSQEASNAILSQALNATVSNRVQRLFGVSRIKIDPEGLTTQTNVTHGPQVSIEQQVTGNLTLTYSANVAQTSQQIIQVEYNVSRNVSIVATRDQNGVVSFDVKIRQRKK